MFINTTKQLFQRDKAEHLAAQLTAADADDEDGWVYIACHCPQGLGYSYIEVREFDGYVVGRL